MGQKIKFWGERDLGIDKSSDLIIVFENCALIIVHEKEAHCVHS